MRSLLRIPLPWLVSAVFVSACGGNSDNGPPPGGSPAPQRGALLQSPPAKLASYSTSDVLAKLVANDTGKLLLQLAYTPQCAVDVYAVQYETVGARSEATTASAALMVPSGTIATCAGAHSVLLYGHGTETSKTFNIADLNDSANAEGLLLAAVFAAQGYIVVAPNYAGYDTSTLSYHPYLNADQQSKDMIDALAAARAALPTLPGATVAENGKLFIAGYSQGGYVAMATHRALQDAGIDVTASAPMSGPYALAAFGDAIFYGDVPFGAPANLTLLISSYQHAYGNIYADVTDIFAPHYAPGIEALLPSLTPISALYSAGKLPASELFSSTPPAPEFAPYTPSKSPTALAPVFAAGFGPDYLLLNSYRLAYLEDAQASPDGGFPTTTMADLPPATPRNTLRQALKTNDLRAWTPSAPMLLCAGDQDPTVLYINTQLMLGYWTTHIPTVAVSALDVDSAASSADAYGNLKTAFAAAKALVASAAIAGGATDGGASAVLAIYHAGLVPPFCLDAVKSFFDGL